MALSLLRLFEAKNPLLPVVVSARARARPHVSGSSVGTSAGNRAVAATMPASAEDYVWTYTETGEASLRPVVVRVGDQTVKLRL